jgi:hypothetical protein
MLRGLSWITILCVAAVAAFGAATAGAHTPVARAAAKTVRCGVGTGRNFGYTYLTSLSARGTSCAAATTLAKHHGNESGWRCTIKRLETSPIQYQSRKTCNDGSRQVVWGFTQNT